MNQVDLVCMIGPIDILPTCIFTQPPPACSCVLADLHQVRVPGCLHPIHPNRSVARLLNALCFQESIMMEYASIVCSFNVKPFMLVLYECPTLPVLAVMS